MSGTWYATCFDQLEPLDLLEPIDLPEARLHPGGDLVESDPRCSRMDPPSRSTP